MRIPSSVQGLLFAPTLVCLFFALKAFCPDSAGSSCFADQFAVPIFLPLVAIYKIFGNSSVIGGHEFLFILTYWAFIGFLVGLGVDLLFSHKKRSKPASPTSTSMPLTMKSVPAQNISIAAPFPDREEKK